MEHLTQKWLINVTNKFCVDNHVYITGEDNKVFCKIPLDNPEYAEIANRIIECVNAFKDLDNPHLYRETWDLMKHLQIDAYPKVKAKHDQLLEFIKKYYQFLNLDAQKEAAILIKNSTE